MLRNFRRRASTVTGVVVERLPVSSYIYGAQDPEQGCPLLSEQGARAQNAVADSQVCSLRFDLFHNFFWFWLYTVERQKT